MCFSPRPRWCALAGAASTAAPSSAINNEPLTNRITGLPPVALREHKHMTVALFAGIRVRDLTAARAWYERLLGEPSFFPNAIEVVWTVADGRSLYIQEDPGGAGGALITLFVDDLDRVIAEIAARGLEPAERETYANGVRKATYRDDDGNEIGFGGPPSA